MKTGLRTLTTCGAIIVLALTTVPVSAKRTTLRWWTTSNYTWKTLKDGFEKEHPDIRIELIDGTLDKFYSMISAGLMPDVWGVFNVNGVTADVTRGWITDLSPYIKRDGKEMGINDFFPGLMAQFKVRGRQYSLPFFNYTDFFWYNTSIYDKAGLQPPPLDASDKSWTWEKMVQNAQKTTVRTGDGRIKQPGLDLGSYPMMVTPTWLHMFNIKLYDEEAFKTLIPQKVYINTPEMNKALTNVWNLFYKEKVAVPGGMSFSGGRTAASLEPGWAIKWTLPIKTLKWRMAPLPWATTNSGTLWPDGWKISSQCKNKEAAWTFLKYLTTPDAMRFIVTDPKGQYLGSPASRKSIYNETLGRDIGKATGMEPADVYRVHSQADQVGVVKEGELIALHVDLFNQLEPIMQPFWQNRTSPAQTAAKLQDAADKAMPVLFKRWLRNVKYTGK